MVSAHQPMDTSNSIMERDIQSIAASVGAIDNGFSPHAHHPRSIFKKRQVVCNTSSNNICSQSGGYIYCCPSDYTCFYSDGWRCDPNVLGLTRGQKIGIGIGVTVAFFALCIIGFVIFFCCCRKVVQVASEAVSGHNNNNNQGAYPQQPIMYGPTGQGYDPAAAPLTQEAKPYSDNTGYYPPPPQQTGYEQYGQQQYAPPPPPPPPPGPPSQYPQSTAPPPPFQQPPPPQGGYH